MLCDPVVDHYVFAPIGALAHAVSVSGLKNIPLQFLWTLEFFVVTLPHRMTLMRFDYHLVLLEQVRALWTSVLYQFSCPAPQSFFLVFVQSQTPYCRVINSIYGTPVQISWFDCSLLFTVSLLFSAFVGIMFLKFSGLGFEYNVRQIVGHLLSWNADKYHLSSDNTRSAFSQMNIEVLKSADGHTHPESAADRSGASMFADRLAQSLGLAAYFVQRSRADERHRRQGSRLAFWTKDLIVAPKDFAPETDSMLTFIDVDQYVDMPWILTDQFKPTLIYTFQPGQVAKNVKEYCYTFDEDDIVSYRVSGGACYTHMVWNYSVDNILTCKTCFGFPYQVASYLIERRETAPDHEVVFLSPTARWTGLRALVAYFTYQAPVLKRLRVAFGKFLRLQSFVMGEGMVVSTGKVNQFACANVRAEIDDTIRTLALKSKYELTMPQTQSFVDGDKVAGAALLEYHSSKVDVKPNVVCPVSDAIRAYQFDPIRYEPHAKSLMVAFMNPFLHECYVPDNVLTSEAQAVDKRVVKVRPLMLSMSPFLERVMNEFVEFMIPVPHLYDPMDDDFLYDMQDRPTQRRILDTSQGVSPKREVQSFVKKESYHKITDPRLISTINGSDKGEYSKFIYSFVMNVLKRQPWYAFGKSPQQIAERVAEVCQGAQRSVTNSDFSKFDGHGSNLMRELERRLLLRAFRSEYHDQLLDLHRSQYRLTAFTTGGICYETEFSRASGSPETTGFNSATNAFVSYTTGRISKEDGSFNEAAVAWEKLGVYGGDDGVTADVDSKAYVRAAQMIGQEVTCEEVLKGSLGVKFLARVYSPDVWFGDVNTCCDLPRQLTKIHVTVQLGNRVTPVMKLLEKARSYYCTDRHTPIIGPFVTRIVFLHNSLIQPNEETAAMRAWGSMLDMSKQYINESAQWMIDYAESVLPDARYAEFHTWLMEVTCLEDCLHPPLLREPPVAKSTSPVVLDAEIITPPTLSNPPAPLDVQLLGKRKPNPIRDESRFGWDNTDHSRVEPRFGWNSVAGRAARVNKPYPSSPKSAPTSAELLDWKERKRQNGTWIDNPTPEQRAAWSAKKLQRNVPHSGFVRGVPGASQLGGSISRI
jgi:hypothetical protein